MSRTFALAMKRFVQELFIWGVLLSVVAQIGYKSAVLAYYLVNQEKIAKELCVRRFEKKSTCNGACHANKLMKMADTAPPAPSSNPAAPVLPDFSKIKEVEWFCVHHEFVSFLEEEEPNTSVLPDIPLMLPQPPLRAVFHPPSLFA